MLPRWQAQRSAAAVKGLNHRSRSTALLVKNLKRGQALPNLEEEHRGHCWVESDSREVAGRCVGLARNAELSARDARDALNAGLLNGNRKR